MSIFNFILSIYLLFLSALPCSDSLVDTCKDSNSNVEARHMDVNSSQEEGDECTPFCICTCCGVAFTVFLFNHFKAIERNFEVASYFILKTPKLIFTSFSIWQPPKLS